MSWIAPSKASVLCAARAAKSRCGRRQWRSSSATTISSCAPNCPALDKDDVRVELTDDGLVIEGERRREHEERLEGGYRSEIEYGRFYRLIPLPEGANIDQAQARINNGVLEVAIPMAEARRQRRSIPVETGAGQAAQTAGEQAQTATGGSGRK